MECGASGCENLIKLIAVSGFFIFIFNKIAFFVKEEICLCV